jgi:hypothetical protein
MATRGGRLTEDYLEDELVLPATNTYSCCLSRTIKVGFGPGPTTNSSPMMPGAIVRNESV